MNILGLDIGDKRIGVAVSNGFDATPLCVLNRAAGRAESELVRIIEKDSIGTVVAGLPLDRNGQPTAQCQSVMRFCRRLSRRVDVKIEYVDEFLSTEEARDVVSRGRSRDRHTGKAVLVDDIAAALILRSYLAIAKSESNKEMN